MTQDDRLPEEERQASPGRRETSPGDVHRTAWIDRDTALRRFLRDETSGGAALFTAAVAALVWANIDTGSYQRVWETVLSFHLGHWGISMDLRSWINSGLMTFFFLVVGLEARREFDVGEFRERSRIFLPIAAGVGGMVGAIGLYLAINAGHSSIHGWGASMSTDTAFSLGVLALLGTRVPDRLRSLVLTVTVVDDIVGLVVIATVYTLNLHVTPLLVAIGLFGLTAIAAWQRVRPSLIYLVLASACWVALFKSGVDPIVVGLGMGLIANATPAKRSDLERATALFRGFREQPTAYFARLVHGGLRTALPPNERLQQLYHPWTSYLIVPLFGLANAGIRVDAGFLSHAYTTPITLGIVVGYVVGKPLGVTASSLLVTRASRGRYRPPVGWAAVAGGGIIAGTGFTVSLLIASVAFKGIQLEEATLGILTAEVLSASLTWVFFLAISRLDAPLRLRALLGSSEVVVDLVDPVDPERDHIRGPVDAAVTIVEYADFQCPFCRRAEPMIRELLRESENIRYVWRHLPLPDVHIGAEIAAEASEAAAAQGAFWAMHDLLLDHQWALQFADLVGYAQRLSLDTDRFADDLSTHKWSDRVAIDVESADLSGVAGTPTFFVNGQRQPGAYDMASLRRVVQAAIARASVA